MEKRTVDNKDRVSLFTHLSYSTVQSGMIDVPWCTVPSRCPSGTYTGTCLYALGCLPVWAGVLHRVVLLSFQGHYLCYFMLFFIFVDSFQGWIQDFPAGRALTYFVAKVSPKTAWKCRGSLLNYIRWLVLFGVSSWIHGDLWTKMLTYFIVLVVVQTEIHF